MSIPTRKSNEAVLDEKMTAAGHRHVGTKANANGSSTVTYTTEDGKRIRMVVSADRVAQP